MGMRDVFRMEIGRFKVAAIGFVAAASLVTASVWWFASAPGGTEEAESRHLAVDAQALAAAVDAPLARFAKLTDSFRPADFSPSDRLAMTARQIRLQGAVPYASATFLANAAGRVVAASAPNPASEADVAQSAWFQRAAAQPPGRLTLQRIDASWLRAGPALLATRSVADESGRLAGVAGAVFSLDDLRSLVMPPWIAPSVAISLTDGEGSPILQSVPSAGQGGGEGAGWLIRLLLALDRLAGRPTTLSATADVHSIRGTVQASVPSETAIRAAWSNPSAAMPGVVLIVGAGLCLLLMLLPGSRRSGDMSQSAGTFGADWSFELDARGLLLSAEGFLPEALRQGIGKPFAEVLGQMAGEGDPACRRIDLAIRARARMDAVDVRMDVADGVNRIQRLGIAPTASGGFRGTARDVSEEVMAATRAEAAEAEAARLLEQSEGVTRDRDRVLAAVGHDVRTPMNSILGICALLVEEGNLEDSQRRWIERITASCEALLAMLNGLLEIASGAAGAELQPTEVDVAALVEEVSGVLMPQANDKGLDLRWRFDDQVHGRWMADPTRLRQVLVNLASNAIKYTGSGRVEIRASSITDAEGHTAIRIAVSDTGPGIAPEDRSVIFERFRRGRGEAAEGREGLGLGLALCRENAALMGGSLTVESTLGVGSEFTFEFRAERPAAEPQAPAYLGRTALIVGFDETKSRHIGSHLAQLGIAVETAEDGFVGLGQAERIAMRCGAIDAVVVNAGMAGMAPDAFFARLRSTSHGRQSAIVVLGAFVTGDVSASAVLPAAADGRQVAAAVAGFLAETPALGCIDPSAAVPGGARILVVEDNKVNQSLLAAALTRRGFTTFVADDGETAVRLAGNGGFNAILMDIQMPGLDGLEATRQIRAMGGRLASMPIIALSALSGAVVQKRCTEVGMTARVVKPVNLDRLAADLRKWIAVSSVVAADSSAGHAPPAESGPADGTAEISVAFLECLVADIGPDRARACVQEFMADLELRAAHLDELVPGLEVEAIERICGDISGRASTVGAIGLSEALDEMVDHARRGDREGMAHTVQRIASSVQRIGASLQATLARLRNKGRDGGLAVA
jgi:signal transduction histidine kinase/DNA-binding response OmpR family regulator